MVLTPDGGRKDYPSFRPRTIFGRLVQSRIRTRDLGLGLGHIRVRVQANKSIARTRDRFTDCSSILSSRTHGVYAPEHRDVYQQCPRWPKDHSGTGKAIVSPRISDSSPISAFWTDRSNSVPEVELVLVSFFSVANETDQFSNSDSRS